jgi:hypothetical protein
VVGDTQGRLEKGAKAQAGLERAGEWHSTPVYCVLQVSWDTPEQKLTQRCGGLRRPYATFNNVASTNAGGTITANEKDGGKGASTSKKE